MGRCARPHINSTLPGAISAHHTFLILVHTFIIFVSTTGLNTSCNITSQCVLLACMCLFRALHVFFIGVLVLPYVNSESAVVSALTGLCS